MVSSLDVVGEPLTEQSSEPVSRLRWYPDRGFELDLNAVVDDTTLTLVAVPLPADGTAELRSQELTLDPLEILFKAQVDLDGVPGQLTRATIEVVVLDGEEFVVLDAEVEDAETGDRSPLSVRAPLVVPIEAPKAGGPKPRPKDESELDWEDEDTFEAYFKDPLTQEDPLPVGAPRRADPDLDGSPPSQASKRPTNPEPPSRTPTQEAGFKRLLSALLQQGEPEEPDEELGEGFDERGRVVPMVSDPADARGLLAYLVEREQLELEDECTVDELVEGAAPILASSKPPAARAEALSSWLFKQDEVAELYIDDEALADLISQW
ncbi:MAG: hypothetical protein EA397_06040 [Deltaproteobacteria bacterium]|nr:MAG: hypothetical protein EA397_06040 [Deltaproteobacteria bacterium]